MRGSMVVSRRPGRGISTGAYSGCQMRAFAILGVAHCLGASLLWAHCRLLASYLNAGFTLLERQGHLVLGVASAGHLVLYVACELL